MLLMWASMSSAFAAMVPTAELTAEPQRAQLAPGLEQREQVKQQLIELGVAPTEAGQRVSQMTDRQVSALQGKMTELPAGAGVSTTNLLLIIIVLILLL